MSQAIQTPEQVSTATGVETTFATVWTFEAAAEVVVIVEIAGVQTVQVQGVDYDVAAGTWLTDGANCVFRAGRLPANGARVIRRRVTPAQQIEPFGDNENFRPLQSEKAYDRLTRQVQEERAKTARGVVAPEGEAGLRLPRVAQRAGRLAGFTAAGEFDPEGRLLADFDADVAQTEEARLAALAAQAAAEAAALIPAQQYAAMLAIQATGDNAPAIAARALLDGSNFTDDLADDFRDAINVPSLNALPQSGPRIALIFDDGYQNNVTRGLPILKKYGFAATIAVEVDRINTNYAGDVDRPVVTAADMRLWIEAGGEISNHAAMPDVNATEAVIATNALTENTRLKNILTGELVWNGSTFVAGTITHPEYASFYPDMGVYRGGLRNATTDKAWKTVFDKLRGIPGDAATKGDGLYRVERGGEFPRFWTGVSIDTGGLASVQLNTLSFIRSLGAQGGDAVFYAHFLPLTTAEGDAEATPYLTVAELEEICREARRCGVQIVPMQALGPANLFTNFRFNDTAAATFVQGAGGSTAAWDETVVLAAKARSIKLVAAAQYTGTNRPSFAPPPFFVRPFSRLKIRIRYKIDTELNRGGANANHGLFIGLSTTKNDSPATADLSTDQYALNTQTLPYAATAGLWEEYETTLITGWGGLGGLTLAVHNAIGTVWIGDIDIVLGESLVAFPVEIASTYNTVLARRITLPGPTNTGSRKWMWNARLKDQPVKTAVDSTVTYAFSDSASIAAPTNGQTAYVLGVGAGAFASRGGQMATYDGTAWGTWVTPANDTIIVASSNGEGFGGSSARYHHRRTSASSGGIFDRLWTRAVEDRCFVQRISDSVFDVWNTSGTRSDAFSLIVEPVLKP